MVVNQKVTGNAASVPAGLAMGALMSLAITVAGAGILAKLLDMEKMIWENIGYGIMILLILSSFFGGLTAYKRIKRQRLLVCMASGAVYYGLLLSITALFFGGQYEAVGVTALLVLGGSLAAGMLGLRQGKKKKPAFSRK